MKVREDGFTLIEVLVVIAILATLAGFVALMIPGVQGKATKLQCQDQVRNLVGLLESANAQRYPEHGGPNLLLYLVVKGQVRGQDALNTLFCPGDLNESLKDAGGVEAYDKLDLKLREYGHLTSYAAREQRDPKKRARKGAMPPQVLICDDSEDHHGGKGIVIGLTGGAAKWRDKVDDYELDLKAPLIIGEGSPVEELVCLSAE